jgi:HK97 family phage prohead protease
MKIERQFAEVRASNEDRKVKFIFSTDSKDRHGTRINPDGWRLDNFNKNGIASFQHRAYGDPDPDMVIGRAQAWKSDGRLVGTIDFEQEDVNPLAEKLYKKVKAGTLNAVSVGFVEHDGHWGQDKDRGHPDEEKDTYYFDDIELMEISLVTVPSNPEALAYRTFEATGVQKWVQTHTEAPQFDTEITNRPY